MPDIKIKCPQCRQKLTVEADMAGERITCPSCHTPMIIPQPRPPTCEIQINGVGVPDAPAKSPFPPKSICPNCRAEMAPDAVICVACGFDVRSGEALVTDGLPSADCKQESKPAPDGVASEPSIPLQHLLPLVDVTTGNEPPPAPAEMMFAALFVICIIVICVGFAYLAPALEFVEVIPSLLKGAVEMMSGMTVLSLVMVIGTSIWVLVDAKSLGVKKGQLNGVADLSPLGWFFGCLGIWIIGFPLYLGKRGELKSINAKGHPTAGVVSSAGQTSKLDLAELEKLAQFRDRGVLTEEEFLSQKAKLLGLPERADSATPPKVLGSLFPTKPKYPLSLSWGTGIGIYIIIIFAIFIGYLAHNGCSPSSGSSSAPTAQNSSPAQSERSASYQDGYTDGSRRGQQDRNLNLYMWISDEKIHEDVLFFHREIREGTQEYGDFCQGYKDGYWIARGK